ncbi:hypothetical protein DDB_G0283975 [Dictyostelium discoideum AX4]|uniref:Methyltransferase type 11 domain-containing protein n=1 Tax=Dictyostelium discoideum TaxID=44689 RepID=Q54QA3_DICDI|nr:hypothetical protein DDB_G0283975 [Dictyostelium discoideum AX4]EAL65475.1 hypothetical protein DDB_G0283975 [Dictyostelium discoideum AX4]|eukprot:XP_638841.1 hypothetical protein DDB_G0283975 [Dictyostelium discoideum AX4]
MSNLLNSRKDDGSAGDVNYAEKVFLNYNVYRQPEPEISNLIHKAFGESKSILNVGAGAGSYEPKQGENGYTITAVEPSASMRELRPKEFSVAIDAFVENLPFNNNQFEASMSTFSIHQWSNIEAGLKEMRRVTKNQVILLTCDPKLVQDFWLNEYAPGVLGAEAKRYPTIEKISEFLGGEIEVISIPLPLLCKDGFNEAYYGRPEMFLNPSARGSCSAWTFVDEPTRQSYLNHLKNDLESGEWDKKYSNLRTQSHYNGSLILIISRPPPSQSQSLKN